ncbi:hypothetical protein ES5_14183 [Dietzia cinnamea P4]|nr:hypothetical protein ES5_14183 [Dietzia cinnamea P4]
MFRARRAPGELPFGVVAGMVDPSVGCVDSSRSLMVPRIRIVVERRFE